MSSGRGVTRHGSMNEWLRSKAPGKGGGSRRLGWKDFKKGTGQVVTWMHTKTLPMTAWRHAFPIYVVSEDKNSKEKVKHVYGRQHTCHETEDVLGKMYWRTERGVPDSARDTPPERCGMCKFDEWLWQACWAWINTHDWDDKAKGWVEPKKGKGEGVDPCATLFHFVSEASDDENARIHVGGYCGLFNKDDLPDDLKKAMAAAKIRQSDAWKENCKAKPKSVLCVVDNDKPGDGVVVAEEAKELGEKVKEEILRVLKSVGKDIQRHPYAIQWEYDRAKQMGKQYSATGMMQVQPTPRILKMIRSAEEPDLSAITTPFNQQEMRAWHEQHCKLPKGTVPWDEIFPSKEQEKEWREQDAQEAAEAEEAEDDEADDEDDAERGSEDRDSDTEGDNPADDPDDDADMVACDSCGKAMNIEASECPHCGHKYDVEADAEPEPEKPKLKTRAEVAAEKKAAAAKKAKPKADPEPEGDDDQSSGVPF
jgi:hypothetical protein